MDARDKGDAPPGRSFLGNGGPGDRSWFELLFPSFTTLTRVGLWSA